MSIKSWLHWGCLEGQTWTQIEENVAFDWSISGYPSLCAFVWLGVDYMLRALICLSVMHVWLLLFICDIDLLTTLIDSLACFSIHDSYCYMIILLSLTCIFSFLYISFILAWLILFIVYYLVYLNILFILVIYLSCLSCFLLSLCVDMDYIHVFCLAIYCMTTLFLRDACIACLCGTHIYPLTSNSLVSVDLVSLDLIVDMRLVALFALRLS